MKRLIKSSFGTLVITGLAFLCHAQSDNFKTNDLYLGFTQSGAQDDYVIDLGQPAAVGAGGTVVQDLSSEVSASLFNGVYTGGPVGVNMAVVGGNTTFNHGDIYAAQWRTNNFGNPALPGSALPVTNVISGNLTTAVATLTSLMQTTGGLPSAGSSALDSSLTYSTIVESTSLSDFPAKSGITQPDAPISGSSNVLMDLWLIPKSSPTNDYLGYFTFALSTGTAKLTFTPAGMGATTAPVAGFSGTPTSGPARLTVEFTDASTGSITNWVWNFGDGHSATNTSNANVSNLYAVAGNYTVTLTVAGPGGANTDAQSGYVTVTNASTAPTAGFTGTPTNGYAPLPVVFTDASSGNITNWLWNFGDGHSITNRTSGNVTNTYAAAANYTVTLNVTGPGGTNALIKTNYISVLPVLSLGSPTLTGGKLGFSGSNGPVGAQYRILTSTNLALAITNWIPVFTNTVSSNGSYGYTNAATTNQSAYYRLVSP